jgi:hypothetical protein
VILGSDEDVETVGPPEQSIADVTNRSRRAHDTREASTFLGTIFATARRVLLLRCASPTMRVIRGSIATSFVDRGLLDQAIE